tara:strand:- start:570 stop:857 length:288 start_codon:yes stop_codon:yes gene_type:complete
MATTPYRKLQEENVSLKKRNKELVDISKAHQKQNGDLQSEIADKDTIINLQKDRLKELEDFRILCHILKITNYFDNARATQMKQARDIVDINYVP